MSSSNNRLNYLCPMGRKRIGRGCIFGRKAALFFKRKPIPILSLTRGSK